MQRQWRIPVALSRHLPEQASLTAVELSDAALGYLQKNVQRHHCSNLTVVQADVLTWQPQQLFDLITSNPPYISDQEMLELQPEVRWEPEMALRAQENGLYFYRVLSKRCQSYLRTGGAGCCLRLDIPRDRRCPTCCWQKATPTSD